MSKPPGRGKVCEPGAGGGVYEDSHQPLAALSKFWPHCMVLSLLSLSLSLDGSPPESVAWGWSSRIPALGGKGRCFIQVSATALQPLLPGCLDGAFNLTLSETELLDLSPASSHFPPQDFPLQVTATSSSPRLRYPRLPHPGPAIRTPWGLQSLEFYQKQSPAHHSCLPGPHHLLLITTAASQQASLCFCPCLWTSQWQLEDLENILIDLVFLA